MSTNPDVQPISLTERRVSRQAQLTASQQRAYRQLAIAALGLDLPTLTKDLRARRLQRMPIVRVLPQSDRAA